MTTIVMMMLKIFDNNSNDESINLSKKIYIITNRSLIFFCCTIGFSSDRNIIKSPTTLTEDFDGGGINIKENARGTEKHTEQSHKTEQVKQVEPQDEPGENSSEDSSNLSEANGSMELVLTDEERDLNGTSGIVQEVNGMSGVEKSLSDSVRCKSVTEGEESGKGGGMLKKWSKSVENMRSAVTRLTQN